MDSLTSASKFLSMVLRHKPEALGIVLDANGWAKVDDLIIASDLFSRKIKFTRETLETIVRTDEKGRYTFNEDGSKIRANQGHSVDVDVELQKANPPPILFHGTALAALEGIKKEGLKRMGRKYLHLSIDRETALKVGKRHGIPVILQIAAGTMNFDGYPFYLSKNGIWLVESVPTKYIEVIP